MDFFVTYDIVTNERLYQRGREIWREKASDKSPRHCIPMCADGWAKEDDVLKNCERVR